MKEIKMIGKNYDVILRAGKKVTDIIRIDKDGTRGVCSRYWQPVERVIEEHEEYGFVIEK